jgi:hypothetical protein
MTSGALLEALVGLPPREGQVVRRVALEGMTPESFAALYGLDEAAAAQLAFRAFGALEPGAPERSLAAFVEEWRTGQGQGVLSALRAGREAALARLERAEAARAASPLRRVEEGLRWVAILGIVGLSLWLWNRERTAAPPPVRSAPRSP